MILTDIEQAVADRIQRTDISAMLRRAVNLGHHRMQIDHAFRGMEAHSNLDFTSTSTDGVAVPSNYRNARRLTQLDTDGTALGVIEPATEHGLETLRREAAQVNDVGGLHEGNYVQRWWEQEQKILLFFLPGVGETVRYRLDYYKFLPDLTDAITNDFLTATYPETLILAACWRGSRSVWEDDRAEMFRAEYLESLQEAIQSDNEFQQGGAYRVYRPPLPGSRRF